MNRSAELRDAVAWVTSSLTFDLDARVHVFELTIRALGALLSTHALLLRNPSAVPAYHSPPPASNGGAGESGGGGGGGGTRLLDLAVDLAERLLPAFDTPTGLPLSWVNLRRGVIPGDTRSTCVACAGTLLLEFASLSQATGDPKYYALAKRAARALHARRSAIGLLGNTLHTGSGEWERSDAGVGAGIDSFYEYLLKVSLL